MAARDLLATATRSAVLSDCGRFRYSLTRRWADLYDNDRSLLFVMLNPSTADAMVDDATIRRCVAFAHGHGFGAIEVVNLFAYRATQPRDLALAGWPPGPQNDERIAVAARDADAICVAWGAVGDRGPACDRVQAVAPILRRAGKPLQCLKITRSGHPQHPLYLRGDCRLQPFTPDAISEAMTP